jgi:hypothetical protein
LATLKLKIGLDCTGPTDRVSLKTVNHILSSSYLLAFVAPPFKSCQFIQYWKISNILFHSVILSYVFLEGQKEVKMKVFPFFDTNGIGGIF